MQGGVSDTKTYLMYSGGKDSGASVALCYESGIHLDGVVTAEIMFSHKKNISAEHPIHAEWLHNTAIPTIERMGYPVIVLKSPKDYIQHFNTRLARSKYEDRIGKKRGFVLGGNRCALKRDLKIKVIDAWIKEQGEFEKILGIAYDETKRLEALHLQKYTRSVLEEYKITEEMTFDIARKYGLLSPFYDLGRKRQGCWFCPNCSLTEFTEFAKAYPDLWGELRALSEDTETVSKYFQYNRTFQEIDCAVTVINSQINIFDLGVSKWQSRLLPKKENAIYAALKGG